MDPHHGKADAGIRDKNEEEREEQDERASYKEGKLIDIALGAGQVEKSRDVTKEVINMVGTAEGQVEDSHSQPQRDHKSPKAADDQKLKTERLVHHCHVAKGLADGYVAVIRHGCKEETFSSPQSYKEMHLGSTAHKRNGAFPIAQQVSQRFGSNDEGITELNGRELAEEKEHWRTGGLS